LKWDSSYFFIAEDASVTAQPPSVNIRIIVPDADTVWSRVSALGFPIIRTIDDRDYGLRDFMIRDPAGFDVRFAAVLNGDVR